MKNKLSSDSLPCSLPVSSWKPVFLLILTVFVFLLPPIVQAQQKLDINQATLEQIQQLPVSPQMAKALYERIQFKGPFTSIYQLWEIPCMDGDSFKS